MRVGGLDKLHAATRVTDSHLKSDGLFSEARKMANHADALTTQVYDPRGFRLAPPQRFYSSPSKLLSDLSSSP
jgi:hypothetical protein